MDRDTKKVLKHMLDTTPGKSGHCLFVHFYDSCVSSTGLSEHRVMASVRQLKSDGYIRYSQNQQGRNIGFELENKAYHRIHYGWEQLRSFLFKSVLVPIAVTLLTNLIASWL